MIDTRALLALILRANDLPDKFMAIAVIMPLFVSLLVPWLFVVASISSFELSCTKSRRSRGQRIDETVDFPTSSSIPHLLFDPSLSFVCDCAPALVRWTIMLKHHVSSLGWFCTVYQADFIASQDRAPKPPAPFIDFSAGVVAGKP